MTSANFPENKFIASTLLVTVGVLFGWAANSFADPKSKAGIPDKAFARKFAAKTQYKLVVLDVEEIARKARIDYGKLLAGNGKEIKKLRNALKKEFVASGVKPTSAYLDSAVAAVRSQSGEVRWYAGEKVCVYASNDSRESPEKIIQGLALTSFWPDKLKRTGVTRIGIDSNVFSSKKYRRAADWHERRHLHQTPETQILLQTEGLTDVTLHIKQIEEWESDAFAELMLAKEGDDSIMPEFAKARLLGAALAGPKVYQFMHDQGLKEGKRDTLALSRFAGAIYRTDEAIGEAKKFADDVKAGNWAAVRDKLNSIFGNIKHQSNNTFLNRHPYTVNIPYLMLAMQNKGGLRGLNEDDIVAISSALVDSIDEDYKRMLMIGFLRSGDGSIERTNKIIKTYYLKDGMSARQIQYWENMISGAKEILKTRLPQKEKKATPGVKQRKKKRSLKKWQGPIHASLGTPHRPAGGAYRLLSHRR